MVCENPGNRRARPTFSFTLQFHSASRMDCDLFGTSVQDPDETLVQWMVGRGFPRATQGRKASELAGTVKLAAFPPTILGLANIFLDKGSKGRSSEVVIF